MKQPAVRKRSIDKQKLQWLLKRRCRRTHQKSDAGKLPLSNGMGRRINSDKNMSTTKKDTTSILQQVQRVIRNSYRPALPVPTLASEEQFGNDGLGTFLPRVGSADLSTGIATSNLNKTAAVIGNNHTRMWDDGSLFNRMEQQLASSRDCHKYKGKDLIDNQVHCPPQKGRCLDIALAPAKRHQSHPSLFSTEPSVRKSIVEEMWVLSLFWCQSFHCTESQARCHKKAESKTQWTQYNLATTQGCHDGWMKLYLTMCWYTVIANHCAETGNS